MRALTKVTVYSSSIVKGSGEGNVLSVRMME
jgi:hypothetical protein